MSEPNPKKRKAEEEQPVVPKGSFRVASVSSKILDMDKRLLETGEFSDVTVECGGTVWSLHKSVLCTRSSYFAKALSGSFEEAVTGKVVIHEFKPEIVREVIGFIYTGQIDHCWTPLAKFPGPIRHCWDLFLAADYFHLEGLMDTVLAQQSAYLCDVAFCSQEGTNKLGRHPEMGPADFLQSSAIDEFFDTVTHVYSHNLDTIVPYKKTLWTFMRQAHPYIIRDAKFKEHLKKIPLLCADLFGEFVLDRPLEQSILPPYRPSYCVDCKLVTHGECGFYEMWIVEPSKPRSVGDDDLRAMGLMDDVGHLLDGDGNFVVSVVGQCMDCGQRANKEVSY